LSGSDRLFLLSRFGNSGDRLSLLSRCYRFLNW
jgi:hypothetical protein